MTKTIGVVSVITQVKPENGLRGTETARSVATGKLNNIYTELQAKTKDLGMTCRLVNVNHVTHNNLRKHGTRCVIVEAVGVFESELQSTHEELESIRNELGYKSLGQYISTDM